MTEDKDIASVARSAAGSASHDAASETPCQSEEMVRAAALDLYEALGALLPAWAEYRASDQNHSDAYYALVKGMWGAWDRAAAAIAKAEGRS